MAYRNDVHFMNEPQNTVESGPEVVEQSSNEIRGLDSSNATSGFNSQAWLSADQSMSGMTPSSGSIYDKNGNGPGLSGAPGLGAGHGDNSHGASGSQDEGPSTGLTPNSSTGTGNNPAVGAVGGTGAKGAEGRPHLAPGQMGDSGRGSFQASPTSPHRNMMSRGDLGSAAQNQFFGDPTSFGISSGLTEPAVGFGIPNSWGEMPSQGNMTPGGEGVLRALINMGPMNAMDLSTWNPSNENMRQ